MTQLPLVHCFDRTLATPEANLALDEVLLLQAEAGRGAEVLRFWQWPNPAVVLGAGGEIEKEVRLENCERDSVPILRRSSGGGTVLLGDGCLLFSLILALDRDPELRLVNSSYRTILGRIADALRPIAEVKMAGICDLTSNGKKFSGNAQQRKQKFLLHHGTILHAFDLTRLSDYLKLPERQPEYRGGKSHAEFVCNLSCPVEQIKTCIAAAFAAVDGEVAVPVAEVERLVAEKYSRQDWVRRR